MINSILSTPARSSVLQLQNIQQLIQTTEGRLATGKKVARPTDNPAAYFTASALSARAGQLSRVLDNFGTQIQTLKAADAAITAMIGIVDATLSDLDAALASPEPHPTATGNIIVSTLDEVDDLAGVSSGDDFSVQVGSGSPVTVNIGGNDTPTDLLNDLNAIPNVKAVFTTEGYLQIASTTNDNLILTNTDGTPLTGLGITAATYDASSNISAVRSGTATTFNDQRTQIDTLAADASLSGVNLLLGDSLTIDFNQDGSSSLTIAGVTFTASGLNIDAAQNSLQLDSDITAAKADLESARDTLRSFASTLASDLAVAEIRKEFNNGMREILLEGADNLTLADLNEESATLLSLQTRQSLATASLSIIGNAESDILRLFR